VLRSLDHDGAADAEMPHDATTASADAMSCFITREWTK
jgi:hypothetical protein